MPDILIRDVPDKMAADLSLLARLRGKDRQAMIRDLLEREVSKLAGELVKAAKQVE